MADYNKITDFSAKDPLASGDPLKLAVGADVDAEYDAISVAISSKENKSEKGQANGYCPLDGGAYVPDANLSPDVMRLDTVQVITSGKGDAEVVLTDGATITPDFADGNTFSVVITDDRTMANPDNPLDGQTITFVVEQDGTGGHTLAWGSKYKWAGGVAPTLTTAAGAIDMFAGKYLEDKDVILMVVSGLDFA
jgi:hypothetical protein